MSVMASQIISLIIIYSSVHSGAHQRKHQRSVSLAFVRRIHRWLVNSPHNWPVTRKMLPFDDVIMFAWTSQQTYGFPGIVLRPPIYITQQNLCVKLQDWACHVAYSLTDCTWTIPLVTIWWKWHRIPLPTRRRTMSCVIRSVKCGENDESLVALLWSNEEQRGSRRVDHEVNEDYGNS